jgi:hypothetical protein
MLDEWEEQKAWVEVKRRMVGGEGQMDEVGELVGWHAIEREYQAPVVRVRVGFLVTSAGLKMAELVLGDEAVGADAEVGGGQAMVVDRIDLGVHQIRIADTREGTHQTDMSKELTSSSKWSNTHVVRMPHGRRWG